jgi:hypothetical protein
MDFEIIKTDMNKDGLGLVRSLCKELYDRVLTQSKEQYLTQGFQEIIAKWFKEGVEHRLGFIY